MQSVSLYLRLRPVFPRQIERRPGLQPRPHNFTLPDKNDKTFIHRVLVSYLSSAFSRILDYFLFIFHILLTLIDSFANKTNISSCELQKVSVRFRNTFEATTIRSITESNFGRSSTTRRCQTKRCRWATAKSPSTSTDQRMLRDTSTLSSSFTISKRQLATVT